MTFEQRIEIRCYKMNRAYGSTKVIVRLIIKLKMRLKADNLFYKTEFNLILKVKNTHAIEHHIDF